MIELGTSAAWGTNAPFEDPAIAEAHGARSDAAYPRPPSESTSSADAEFVFAEKDLKQLEALIHQQLQMRSEDMRQRHRQDPSSLPVEPSLVKAAAQLLDPVSVLRGRESAEDAQCQKGDRGHRLSEESTRSSSPLLEAASSQSCQDATGFSSLPQPNLAPDDMPQLCKGSVGHPEACAEPCKYATKSRGCKDGLDCQRCHLCHWRPLQRRERKRSSLARELSKEEELSTVCVERLSV